MDRKSSKSSTDPKISKKEESKENEEISEEDKRLQEELNLLIEKLTGPETLLYAPALETLRVLIRGSTTSMTSVPKPLKYLRGHYDALKEAHKKMADCDARRLCSDVLSVLSMAVPAAGKDRECLQYCLNGSMADPGGCWGHDYVRHLEAELVAAWLEAPAGKETAIRGQLLPLAKQLLTFDLAHNAEIQACDMLAEVGQLGLLPPLLGPDNYPRVCLYLLSCAQYVEESESQAMLSLVLGLYRKFREFPRALHVAMELHDEASMLQLFEECNDPLVRKQMAYLAARQQVRLDVLKEEEETEQLRGIMSNGHLSEHFLSLARELDIMEPKTPDEVFKTWLETGVMRPTFHVEAQVDSARHNLASSFVNAFVNAGFGRDKLVAGEEGKNWIYRNKDSGMMSATASLGLVYLWDVDGGLSPIDRYLYSTDDHVKAGALLALGIVTCGVHNECEPAKALLADYLTHKSPVLRLGAVFGLGLAYAGSNNADVVSLLLPTLQDPATTTEVVAMAAASCALVAVGSCDAEITSALLQTLIEATPPRLASPHSKLLSLALGLLYLGRRDAIEASSAALEVIPQPYRSAAQTTLEMCAYAGTGDVLVVQELLHVCSEHYEPREEKSKEKSKKDADNKSKSSKEKISPTPSSDKSLDDDGSTAVRNSAGSTSLSSCSSYEDEMEDLSSTQAVAALGVAVVSLGEEIGSEMAVRIFGQLGRYGDPVVRRAMPLALAISSVSDPQMNVVDILHKFSHDSDMEVALNSIFSLGLVAAGTNNARVAAMLRQLAQFHTKSPSQLFMVRLAQGLVHMGKGTLTLAPLHSDRRVLSPVALAGLLLALFAFLDTKNLILGSSHYLLYALVPAMRPRWLVTLDDNLSPLPVSVRVGQAVDVVGKAGTPKTIAGVHTHTTPVLLGVGERAELATEEYEALTPVMEDFVILKKKEVAVE